MFSSLAKQQKPCLSQAGLKANHNIARQALILEAHRHTLRQLAYAIQLVKADVATLAETRMLS